MFFVFFSHSTIYVSSFDQNSLAIGVVKINLIIRKMPNFFTEKKNNNNNDDVDDGKKKQWKQQQQHGIWLILKCVWRVKFVTHTHIHTHTMCMYVFVCVCCVRASGLAGERARFFNCWFFHFIWHIVVVVVIVVFVFHLGMLISRAHQPFVNVREKKICDDNDNDDDDGFVCILAARIPIKKKTE